MLIINSLPNENPKFYLGSSLKIKSQLITTKNLKNYIGEDSQDLFDEENSKS